jgi:predicted ATPase/class 3 adenylate cyclase
MSEVRALLLTDVVDSTALWRRLGDDAMAALWSAHDRVARDLLRQWRGLEIDKSDGFLTMFESVDDAVGYVIAYHAALAALGTPIKARAGLHFGVVLLRENNAADVARGAKPLEVGGLALPIAARVMSIAQAGQTLLTAQALAALNLASMHAFRHGHWHVKGLEEPIEVFEVGSEEASFTLLPQVSEKAYRVVRRDDLWVPLQQLHHSLPAERDAFIGRRAALRSLAARIDAGTRLVSILGIGGTGKTRLAQRFAWTVLGEFSGGIWFCDLSQARSLDGVCHAVAQGMGIPLGQTDPATQLGNALAGRGACLVILDNFEQVARHAEATVGHWLDRTSDARFIVTSREVLGIAGEDVLSLDTLPTSEAAELFRCRAEAVRHDFHPTAVDRAAIEPLVRLLDGLPLAIELAAARVRVMSPHTLLERMSERFSVLVSSGGRRDRQATLRAAFDWSWDLLSGPERAALAQLSVFEGGCTLRAVEAVVDLTAVPAAHSAVDTLQSLIEKSLVRQRADGRFDLLVSVREYAAEHLRTPGRFEGSGADAVAAVQRRHCAFFSTLGEAAAVADACADLNNLIAACRSAVALGDVPAAVGALEGAWAALRLRGPFRVGAELAGLVRAMPSLGTDALARVDCVSGWALRNSGHVQEAEAFFHRALAAARTVGDCATERRVLSHLGDLHVVVGRVDTAHDELASALRLAREAGDPSLETEVLNSLGNLFESRGNLVEAGSHYEGSLHVARAIGNRRWEGGSLGSLGLLRWGQGKLAEAREYYVEALNVARELGDRQWEGNVLCNMGLLDHDQGRLTESLASLDSALNVANEIGHVRLGAVVMCNLGIVHEAMREPDAARKHLEAGVAVVRELGDRRSEGQFLNYLGALNARQGQFDEAWACLDTAERLLTEVEDRLNLGLSLCCRSEAEHLGGDANAARDALARAAAIAEQVGAPLASELGVALARMTAMLHSETR